MLASDELRGDLKSLTRNPILRKPTEQKDDGGDMLFEIGSWPSRLPLQWIESGARDDYAENAPDQHLEIQSGELIFARTGGTVWFRVLAHRRDGQIEDAAI